MRNTCLIAGGVLGGLLLLAAVAAGFRKKEHTPAVPAKLAKSERKPDRKSEEKPVKSSDDPPVEKWNTPAFQQWVRGMWKGMSADEHVAGGLRKLRGTQSEVRREDRRHVGRALSKTRVRERFGFITDNVSDISPVLALKWLRCLNCSGN